MKKVAVVLAGCGVYDGAEINEAVLSLLALEEQGAEYQCFAPDIDQMHVVNHLTGEVSEDETRNVLVEAARIARGNIKDIKEAHAEDFDALLVPGGFGAAKNLSDFAVAGGSLTVQADFLAFAQAMYHLNKPVGLVCIAPAMSAAICGEGVECTIGTDLETASAIEQTGAKHINCPVDKAHVDKDKKLVSTPAYMLAGSVSEAAAGIRECVAEMLAMA
jgi:enhancing lycopene biosynthesis protein 2